MIWTLRWLAICLLTAVVVFGFAAAMFGSVRCPEGRLPDLPRCGVPWDQA